VIPSSVSPTLSISEETAFMVADTAFSGSFIGREQDIDVVP